MARVQESLPGLESPASSLDPHPPRAQKNMTRAENLDAGQLAMFMSGKEIQDRYEFLPADLETTEADYYSDADDEDFYEEEQETPDQGWERKLDEAHDSGLYQHMERGGQVPPVHLAFHDRSAYEEFDEDDVVPTVAGGHHRIAVHADLGDEARPLNVYHHTDVQDAFHLRTIGALSSQYREQHLQQHAPATSRSAFHEAASDYQAGWRYR